MSGSTSGISREKGGVQVREMMESSGIGIAVREPTARRRPTIWRGKRTTLCYNHKCTDIGD